MFCLVSIFYKIGEALGCWGGDDEDEDEDDAPGSDTPPSPTSSSTSFECESECEPVDEECLFDGAIIDSWAVNCTSTVNGNTDSTSCDELMDSDCEWNIGQGCIP